MIRSSEYSREMEEKVEPALRKIEKEEKIRVKGGTLSVRSYVPADARTVMLLLHGTSESAEKYHEMIWLFNQMGIGVVAPDMRGHGKSFRMTDNPFLIYVDRFEDYVDDAEILLEQVKKTAAGQQAASRWSVAQIAAKAAGRNAIP